MYIWAYGMSTHRVIFFDSFIRIKTNAILCCILYENRR